MILGLGVDVVEIPRIEKALSRFGERFLKRILTAREISWLAGRGHFPARVAALFAAKEACAKALGTGLSGLSWQEMEVIHEESGRPVLRLSGAALRRFQALGGQRVHLSLSHERKYAVAVVILEGEDV